MHVGKSFGEEHGLPSTNTLRIEEGDDGCLWITYLDAVVKFDGERAFRFRPGNFPYGIAIAQFPSSYDVWWSHDEQGLHVLIGGRVKTYAIDDKLLSGASINLDRSGNIWVRRRSSSHRLAACYWLND